MGRDVIEIASLIIGLALVGLIITRSGNTAQVIGAASRGFGDLLSVATFQGGGGFSMGINNYGSLGSTF